LLRRYLFPSSILIFHPSFLHFLRRKRVAASVVKDAIKDFASHQTATTYMAQSIMMEPEFQVFIDTNLLHNGGPGRRCQKGKMLSAPRVHMYVSPRGETAATSNPSEKEVVSTWPIFGLLAHFGFDTTTFALRHHLPFWGQAGLGMFRKEAIGAHMRGEDLSTYESKEAVDYIVISSDEEGEDS
jgi:hypothetical protein